MAKDGQLWDDSALVKALNDAISKYKIMHGKGGENGMLKEERVTKDTEESAPLSFNESNEVNSASMETDDKTTDVPKNTTHTGETKDSSAAEKCASEAVEQHTSPSNGVQVQETDYTYVNAESAETYNLLLNQYNAVEEQRQKLLEQLYQYGNWDYQGYSYGYGYDGAYDPQYQPVPAPQPSGPPTCTCRPHVCPYSTAPCTSMAAVSSCETCVGGSTALAHSGCSVSLEDGAFIKAAMGAVDRAIHSSKTQTSEVDKEGRKGEEVEVGSRNVAQDKTCQTELSAVLNAWFSAGFYTGKYVSEQAAAKK